jgi:hypothetical protein
VDVHKNVYTVEVNSVLGHVFFVTQTFFIPLNLDRESLYLDLFSMGNSVKRMAAHG